MIKRRIIRIEVLDHRVGDANIVLFSLAKMSCRLTQMSLRFVTALNEWTSDSVRTLVVEQNSCKLLIVFTAVGERFDRGTSVAIPWRKASVPLKQETLSLFTPKVGP